MMVLLAKAIYVVMLVVTMKVIRMVMNKYRVAYNDASSLIF